MVIGPIEVDIAGKYRVVVTFDDGEVVHLKFDTSPSDDEITERANFVYEFKLDNKVNWKKYEKARLKSQIDDLQRVVDELDAQEK